MRFVFRSNPCLGERARGSTAEGRQSSFLQHEMASPVDQNVTLRTSTSRAAMLQCCFSHRFFKLAATLDDSLLVLKRHPHPHCSTWLAYSSRRRQLRAPNTYRKEVYAGTKKTGRRNARQDRRGFWCGLCSSPHSFVLRRHIDHYTVERWHRLCALALIAWY